MILKVKEIVRNILEKDERAKDNDELLCASVWYKQAECEANDMTAVQFLKKMANGNLHKPESITRCRRKLQELHLNLRGKKYEERKNTMTKNWIEELRIMDTESKGATHEQS